MRLHVLLKMIIGLAAVTREIVIACRQIGQSVADSYAALIASHMVNPNTGTFFVDNPLDENDAKALVEASVRKIFAKNDPVTETIKLQAIYEASFMDESRRLLGISHKRQQEYDSILSEILAFHPTQMAKSGREYELLADVYKRVFDLVVCKVGNLDTPGGSVTSSVQKQIMSTLETVFPRVTLRAFLPLSPEERSEKLSSICDAVLGVRLYNRAVGLEVDDLPVLGEENLKRGSDLSEMLKQSLEDIDCLASLLETLLVYRVHGDEQSDPATSKDPASIAGKKRRDELVYVRQLFQSLAGLEANVSQSQEQLIDLLKRIEDILNEIDTVIHSSGASNTTLSGKSSSTPGIVSKELILPLFAEVGKVFQAAHGSSSWLSSRQNLFKLLKTLMDPHLPSLTAQEETVVASFERRRNPRPLHLDETAVEVRVRVQEANNAFAELLANPPVCLDLSSAHSNAVTVEAPSLKTEENTENFSMLPLEFRGFCCWTLSKGGGLLTLGDPSLGIVLYKERFCVFAHEKARNEFMQNPEQFFVGAHSACLRNPSLIHLLGLGSDFPKSSLSTLLQKAADAVENTNIPLSQAAQSDAGTMTDSHPVESHIDNSYCWNLWDVRRAALHAANIRQRTTTECQTVLSQFLRESETQVYEPKDVSCQLVQDSGTNPVRFKRYITGLRGAPTSEKNKGNYKGPAVHNIVFDI